MKTLIAIVLLLGFFPFSEAAEAPIKIGMSVPLTGLTSEIGIRMEQGIEIYFAKVNAEGGIGGRPLQLIALDDGYEPALAGSNMRQLIDQDQVLAVIGNVGTPTAVVTVPIANEKRVLLFGALSGSDVLRKVPPDRYIINFRASYDEETANIINGLLSIGIKPNELAFFIQNDAYGDSGYEGAMKALKAAGYPDPEDLPSASYTRNTMNVEEGYAELFEVLTPPKAVVIIGTYAPVAKFIKMVKKQFPNTLFATVSFIGSTAFQAELGEEGNQIVVTEVVPYLNPDLPASREYREDFKKYASPQTETSFVTFEGYLTAKLFVMGLKRAAAHHQLTREGIIDAFESMKDVDIGIGVKITLDKDHHQALHSIWPTILENGQFKPLNWAGLKRKIPKAL